MCKVIEDMRKEEREEGRQEGRQEGLQETALRMLEAKKYELDEIAVISGLPIEEVKKLQAERIS